MTGTSVRPLLDEHVSRAFQRVLEERGHDVLHATDRFGEHTVDEELLAWAGANDVVLCTNDTRDFQRLAERVEHVGLVLYRDQNRPDVDPEGLARALDVALEQYDREELVDEMIELDEWYEWLQE